MADRAILFSRGDSDLECLPLLRFFDDPTIKLAFTELLRLSPDLAQRVALAVDAFRTPATQSNPGPFLPN